MRKAINITINGETHTFREWAEISGAPCAAIKTRYYRGIRDERLIAPSAEKAQSITINSETHTLREWAEIANLSYGAIRKRYRKGIRGEELIKPSRIKSKRIKPPHIKRDEKHKIWGNFVWIGDKK